MTLARSVVVPGMINEYDDFANLLGALSGEQWETASRCTGWRVADVAAHVPWASSDDVTAFRLDASGHPRSDDAPSGRASGIHPRRVGRRATDHSEDCV